MRVMLTDSQSDPVRLAFVHVFRKREGMLNADGSKSPDKYEVNPVFRPDGANAAKVRAAIEAVAKERYGVKPVKTSDARGNTTGEKPAWQAELDGFAEDQSGLRIGNKKTTRSGTIYDGFEGMVYVAARNETRPTVVDCDKTPLVVDDGRPYAGCYGNVEIDVWALNKTNVKRRICTDLLGVQFSRDGDAFSAAEPPSDPNSFPDLSAEPEDAGMLAD